MLLFIAAEVLITTTITTVQIRAREKILQKWQEGSLSYEELKTLKHLVWFRKLWKPTEKLVSRDKKQN